MNFIVTEPDFPEEWLMVPKMGQKHASLEFTDKIGHEVLLTFYYLLCYCRNPIYEKILVRGICAKMFSGNHFQGIFH